MEMCWFGLVFLLVLCTTLPAEAQPPNVMARYQRFVNRHVFQGMTKANCTREIYKRAITDGNTNKCKKVNSFILSTTDQVRAVCGKDIGVYTSTQLFPVITCKLHGGLTQPDCDYGNKARNNTRYITIGCEQGWPVLYKENLSVIG
ncbi:ribonuclease-like 3 [Clarias gariepinus]|uniref:ribonuclease-like 3 n=1 Tax=Clarias gariepinus TaxID=13013 RepID=UPI00234D47DC|nr:ribonuclease-like 3 [Clarias gariepinus]